MGDSQPLPEDTWRILVATDTHLGYMERDPIRRGDSFDAFDEILTKAEAEQVDFVLLAGDLFHDNNPSRYTLHRTMTILKEHCFGKRPGGHAFQIMSEQSVHFQRASYANISDDNVQIKLPIFSIHGNHDDPGEAALAALDLLHVTSMINYFGKTEVADEITIQPLMLKKGESVLALYGLGNIRDERLRRMWNADRVHFAPPPPIDHILAPNKSHAFGNKSSNSRNSNGSGTFPVQVTAVGEKHPNLLSVLVLHQNRVPHTTSSYISEDKVSDFDFVVWGHEHECQAVHTTRTSTDESCITQPGSSVATSLSEGEAVRKHVVLLEVCKNMYSVTPLPLHSVRPFRLEHVNLASLNIPRTLPEQQMQEVIAKKLADEIERILREIRADTCTDGSNANAIWTNDKLPLIRLKVNYTGYTIIPSKRFGQGFVNRLANPGDILKFSAKRTVSITQAVTSMAQANVPAGTVTVKSDGFKHPFGSASSMKEAEAMLELAPQHTNIEKFLQTQLASNLQSKLGIFQSKDLIRALHTFAERDSGGGASLSEALEKQLKQVQLHIIEQPLAPQFRPNATSTIDRQVIVQFAADFHQQQLEREEQIGRPRPNASMDGLSTALNNKLPVDPTANNGVKQESDVKPKFETTDFEDDYDQYEEIPPSVAENDLSWTELDEDLSIPERRKRSAPNKSAALITPDTTPSRPILQRGASSHGKRASAASIVAPTANATKHQSPQPTPVKSTRKPKNTPAKLAAASSSEKKTTTSAKKVPLEVISLDEDDAPPYLPDAKRKQTFELPPATAASRTATDSSMDGIQPAMLETFPLPQPESHSSALASDTQSIVVEQSESSLVHKVTPVNGIKARSKSSLNNKTSPKASVSPIVVLDEEIDDEQEGFLSTPPPASSQRWSRGARS